MPLCLEGYLCIVLFVEGVCIHTVWRLPMSMQNGCLSRIGHATSACAKKTSLSFRLLPLPLLLPDPYLVRQSFLPTVSISYDYELATPIRGMHLNSYCIGLIYRKGLSAMAHIKAAGGAEWASTPSAWASDMRSVHYSLAHQNCARTVLDLMTYL